MSVVEEYVDDSLLDKAGERVSEGVGPLIASYPDSSGGTDLLSALLASNCLWSTRETAPISYFSSYLFGYTLVG